MNIFIAGIMQGSEIGATLHSQNYRAVLKKELSVAFPAADVYDPFEKNKNSINYSDDFGKQVFLEHNRMCGTKIDLLVAFAPEASMGTAIEMWEAWKNGAFVATISPMAENWAIKFLSDVLYRDLDAFLSALRSGELTRFVATASPRAKKRSLESY